MLESYFLKGLLVAIIFGVPAGAIGALTIQHSLQRGFLAGFITGLGSTAADILYACIGVFGLTMISDFLIARQRIVSVLGGSAIVLLGIMMFRKKAVSREKEVKASALSAYFMTSFLIAIMNPATILSFFVAFAAVGITDRMTLLEGAQILAGIAVGTCFWWVLVSAVVSHFREKINDSIYQRLNQVLGILMMVFGVVLVAR